MDGIEKLLTVARAYAEIEQIGLSAVSSRALDDSKRLVELENGKDIQVRRLERTMQWFSDNWPAAAPWPSDVPRPARSAVNAMESSGASA